MDHLPERGDHPAVGKAKPKAAASKLKTIDGGTAVGQESSENISPVTFAVTIKRR
jgi:hypothetical protein